MEHYGDILFKLGDEAGAREQWQRARNWAGQRRFGTARRRKAGPDHVPRLHPTLRLLPGLLVVVACKSTRPAMDATRDPPARSPEKLIERLTAAQGTDLRYYSAKADVSVEGPDGSRSFKAHLRVVRDSAAWISVVPALGIEVARAVLGTDSLKVLDKLNDHYFLGTLDSAKARFGLQPDLALLQDAVYGKAIGLDPQEKYRADREDGQYVLTSREKKRFVRAAEELAPDSSDAGGLTTKTTGTHPERAEDRDAVVTATGRPDDFRVTRAVDHRPGPRQAGRSAL